jgi:hypothetical protein
VSAYVYSIILICLNNLIAFINYANLSMTMYLFLSSGSVL